MPLAVTHVLVPIILFELLRDSSPKLSKFFSRKHTFLIGIAGLLPDVDSPLYTLLTLFDKSVENCCLGHRILFHNIWIPFGFLGFFFIIHYLCPRVWKMRKSGLKSFESFGKVFLILFVGFSIHMVLDAVLIGPVAPFYPLSPHLVDLDLVGKLECLTGIPGLTTLVSLDALLLLFWFWHEEFTHKIKDYF